MSFSRVVFVLLSLLLALLLAASLALNVVHARHYLSRQLAVHAQDSATALALSLAPALRRDDRVEIESLVKAVGDGGYFRRIRVLDAAGGVLADRVGRLDIAGVPPWFVQALPLETPTRGALVMDGWREAGRVEVSSHPGYAYQQLWDDARDLLLGFAVLGALALAVALALARSALRPLALMERQAQAIGGGQFSLRVPAPWARELRQVALALNKMAGKVNDMLNEKIRTIEKLEIAAHRDALTGLYTRDFLGDRIDLLMRKSDARESVALLLIRLGGLAEVNARWGYAAGDDLLRQLAAWLREQEQQLQGALAARNGGAECVLLVRETSHEEALALANGLLARLQAYVGAAGARAGSAHIGIGVRDSSLADPSRLFSQADMALRVAESRGRYWAHVYPPDTLAPAMNMGASRWREIIEGALAQQALLLYEQPVLAAGGGAPLYYELLVRLRDADGRLIGAGAFMPMAHRLGLSIAIDRAMVELALAQPFADAVPRVLNLSLDAIRDLVFTTWLRQRFRERGVDAHPLLIELPERAAAEAPECVSRLMSGMEVLGVRFGFDHVGLVPEALAQIRHMRPAFLKCDKILLASRETAEAKRALLEMLMEFTRALECTFIVAGIETEAQAASFRAMGAGALQGHALGVPYAVRAQ